MCQCSSCSGRCETIYRGTEAAGERDMEGMGTATMVEEVEEAGETEVAAAAAASGVGVKVVAEPSVVTRVDAETAGVDMIDVGAEDTCAEAHQGMVGAAVQCLLLALVWGELARVASAEAAAIQWSEMDYYRQGQFQRNWSMLRVDYLDAWIDAEYQRQWPHAYSAAC